LGHAAVVGVLLLLPQEARVPPAQSDRQSNPPSSTSTAEGVCSMVQFPASLGTDKCALPEKQENNRFYPGFLGRMGEVTS